MILIIKPILFAFLKSDSVKQLVVDLLTAYVARTDNKLDDKALEMAKAKEEKFNELHNLVTEEFLKRVRSGEATTQDLKAACDWLKTNDITGVALEGTPLAKLAAIVPKVDPELVQHRLYGRTR